MMVLQDKDQGDYVIADIKSYKINAHTMNIDEATKFDEREICEFIAQRSINGYECFFTKLLRFEFCNCLLSNL